MKQNKTIFLIALAAIMLFSSTSTVSNQTVSKFEIGYMIDKVFLKWQSDIEESVQLFEIERSYDNLTYLKIGQHNPKGNFSEYLFIDSNIFKATSQTFYYRLKIKNNDGTFSHTNILQLTPRVSSAKQTWGSIKKIFH